MRSLGIFIGAALFALTSTATASPQGSYGGLSVGYGMGDVDTDVTVSDQDYYLTDSIDDIEANNPSSLDTDAFMVGGFLGHMWSVNGGSFGFEGDINWYNGDDAASVTREYPCCDPTTWTVGHAIERNWLATLRARGGFDAAPNIFLYVTGGLAMGDADYSISVADTYWPIPTNTGTNSETMVGWTVGVGGEFMKTNGVSIRAEYLYVDLGDIEATTDLSHISFEDQLHGTAEVTDHIFRLSAVFGF